MVKTLKPFFFAALTMIVVACAASSSSESTGEYIDSSAMTVKVKARLVDQLGSKALAIKVKTYKDQVQLSGFVDNENVKQKAGMITGRVANVKRVINNITLK